MEKNEFQAILTTVNEVTLVGPMLHSPPKKFDHPFIYVDRGSHFRETFRESAKKGYSDISVGDGDSSEGSLDINLPADKDYSDLKFALDLLPKNIKRVNLWGFLGGRRDHEIINFGEVQNSLLKSLPNALFSFEELVFGKNKGPLKININGIFSLLVFQPTEVKIEGECQYKLPKFREILPLSSHGLSNQGNGEVIIEATAPFFVFLS
jgi:thiamine pyrophosphokinase